MESLFDFIGELFIKFFVGVPDASDFDLSGSVASVQDVLGYLNYLFPISTLVVIFDAWVFIILTVTFLLFFIKTIYEAINPF